MAKESTDYTPYPSLHQISDRFLPVDWLWPFWIPRGMLTLLGGAPGVGKSLVALDLARRIIHDDPFPDGTPVPCPGSNILIVDAENAPALLIQRTQAWNIDSRRLFPMLAPSPSACIDLAQPKQQLHLINMIKDIRPALVVIDSLAGATATAETSLRGARALLTFLSTLAQRANLALLVVHHLRKRARSGPPSNLQVVADDLRGSSHLSAAARSVLALSPLVQPSALPIPTVSAPSPSPPPAERRRLEVVKTNLSRRPPPLELLLQSEDAPVPTLSYSALDETWHDHPSQPTRVSLCARWLLDFLARAGEPVKPSDLVRAAAEANFSRATLYRARRALADSIVELGTGPHDPNKRWILAAEPSPSPPPEASLP